MLRGRHLALAFALLGAACTFTGLGDYTLLCVPGVVSGCSGQYPATCNAAGTAFVPTGSPCTDPTSVCLSGQCVACTPSTTKCEDGTHTETCEATGSWSAPVSCGVQICAQDKCADLCTPGSTQCSGDAEIQTCNGQGTWGSAVACTNQACVKGTCVGVCSPGATACADDMHVKTCSTTGQWNVAPACSSQACVNGACIGDCTPGEPGCTSPTQPAVCSQAGELQETGAACAGAQTCCSAVCTDLRTNTNCGGCGIACTGTASCVAGSCVCPNVETDVNNCGSCGHVCASGQTCYRGLCGGVIASGMIANQVASLTVGPSAVVWTNGGGVSIATLAGGSVSIADIDVSGFIPGVAITSSAVFWTTSNGAFDRAPLQGSGLLVMGVGDPVSGPAVSGDSVFYATSKNVESFSVNFGDAGSSTLATEAEPTAFGTPSGGCVADSTNVYWTSSNGVLAVPLTGGSVTTMVAASPESISVGAGLAIDATHVYYWQCSGDSPCDATTSGAEIEGIPIAGGAPVSLATVSGGVSGIATDGTSVYWTQVGNGDASSGGALLKVPSTGGTPTTLASGTMAFVAVAVDSTSVYWLDQNTLTMAPK